jgi:translocation and assembly module TamB
MRIVQKPLVLFCIMLLPFMAAAQEAEDKGFLTRLIEGSLSGDGRDVEITGFAGALSARATITRLSVADADGIWLDMHDLVLDWDRAALISGALVVRELSAARIDLLRRPVPPPGTLPDAEARAWRLPDLPVSVDIGAVQAKEITLGADLLGEPVALRLGGRGTLADGVLDVALEADRSDGAEGALRLALRRDELDDHLEVTLALREGAGGIAARALDLPGLPPVALEVRGTGPVTDFAADIALETDGAARLTGSVGARATDGGATRWRLDLKGDVRALVTADYHPFFGPESGVEALVTRTAEGGTEIERIAVATGALQINGAGALDADGWPRRMALSATLDSENGAPLRLPVAGAETSVACGRLELAFDAARGERWRLDAALNGLTRGGMVLPEVTLAGGGRIAGLESLDAADHIFTADLKMAAREMRFDTAALSDALGSDLAGQLTLERQGDGPLRVTRVDVTGPDLRLDGAGELGFAPFVISGSLAAGTDNLGRFSALAGRTLGGAGDLEVVARYAPADGALQLDLRGDTTDLTLDQPEVDAILRGAGTVRLALERDTTGTRLETLDLRTANGSVAASGAISSAEGRAEFRARVADIGLLVPELRGPAEISAEARRPAGRSDWDIRIDGEGPGQITLAAEGSLAEDMSRARGTLSGTAPLGLANPLIEPRRIGGLTRYDLRIDGPARLEALRGTISIADARLTAPTFGQALEAIGGTVRLENGAATIDLGATLAPESGAVRLTGRLGLAPPFDSTLTAALDQLIVRDPALYEATVNGTLTLGGPLARSRLSGDIQIPTAELRVPSSPIGVVGDLPPIRHRAADSAIRQTLERAGLTLDGTEADSTGGPSTGGGVAVDLRIDAPQRIFVRGRGLDAELGGQLTLTGQGGNIVPQGQFDLIRGRLDILQQRFTLTEGAARVEGDFVPVLRLVASTTTRTGLDVNIIIEGRADAPEIRLTSLPDLPEDEILAQLIFGRDFSEITPLQAVQLASAASTLAGRDSGLLNQIRSGIGLDDLDVVTTSEGAAAVRLGQYLGENLYTGVEIGSDGRSAITLNLDIAPGVTARGSTANDGESSLGIFFEKDY